MSTSEMPVVTIWLCLQANGQVGLWYRDEADAMKHKDNFTAVYPVDIPARLYVGLPITGSKPVDVEAESERKALKDGL